MKKLFKSPWFFLIVLIILMAAWRFWPWGAWKVTEEGKLVYPAERGSLAFERNFFNASLEWTEEKVVFESRGTKIYGFLFTPKGSGPWPAVLLLPGGGVDKKGEENLAKRIANWKYVVLTIDQRGVGETDGPFPSLAEDYQTFLENREPVQHLVVYDALRSFDLLRTLPTVDKSKIFLVGESMGGRIGMAAAALEPRFAGIVVFSSAGFHVGSLTDKNQELFLRSIDPDTYAPLISPRQLVFFQAQNDTIVQLEETRKTFDVAREPKEWNEFPPCGHGYCDKMEEKFREALAALANS